MSGRSTIYQCDGACECERGNGKSGLQGTKGFIIIIVVVGLWYSGIVVESFDELDVRLLPLSYGCRTLIHWDGMRTIYVLFLCSWCTQTKILKIILSFLSSLHIIVDA